MTSQGVIDAGIEEARRHISVPALIVALPVNPLEALRLLERMENELEESRQKLESLVRFGAARPEDVAGYEVLRRSVYRSTQIIASPILAWVKVHSPLLYARLPRPRLAPAVSARADLSGFGLGPVVLAPWMIAGVMLIALASLAVVALALLVTGVIIWSRSESARDVEITQAKTKQYLAMINARAAAFQQCIHAGGDAAACAATAAGLHPTPLDALAPLPPTTGEQVSMVIEAGSVALGMVALISAIWVGRDIYNSHRNEERALPRERRAQLPRTVRTETGRARRTLVLSPGR